MKPIGITILVLFMAAIGLVVGYVIFGRLAGDYVSIDVIFRTPDDIFDRVTYSLADIESIRQNILISGAVGGVLGLIIGLFTKLKAKSTAEV